MAIDLNEKVMVANYSAAIVRLANSYGISEKTVLEKTGISLDELNSSDLVMSVNQNIRLISNAIALTQTPHLGLIFGQNLNVTAHGMMGIAIMSSKNWGDALKIVCKYIKTRFAILSATCEISNNKLIITIKQDSPINSNADNQASVDTSIHFAVETISSSIRSVAKLLSQQPCDDFSYQFAYPEPAYPAQYTEALGDNVFFNEPINSIIIPAVFAEQPLPFYDEVTLKTALKNCDQALFSQQVHLLMKHKIRNMLDKMDGELPNIEILSKKLNMCSRTIRRKLQAEGTSYQKIVNERRLELAKKYLLNPNLSIIQISSKLDFSDPSYFARVFKQWTGYLPTEYRKQYKKCDPNGSH